MNLSNDGSSWESSGVTVSSDSWGSSVSSMGNWGSGVSSNWDLGDGVDWGVDSLADSLDGVGSGLVNDWLADGLVGSDGSVDGLGSVGGDVLEDWLGNVGG